MNPSLLHQELARHKHAEILREASRRYAPKPQAIPEPEPRATAWRRLRRLVTA